MHIGFIMDGNRRWAKQHLLKSFDGHRRGLGQFQSVVEACVLEGCTHASFWALAKKNIEERSADELAYLYDLIREMIAHFRVEAAQKNLSFGWIGNRTILPPDIVTLLDDAREETSQHTGMMVIVAIGYGGQDEIIQGIRHLVSQGVDLASLDEKRFAECLSSGSYPPPDLIIRTGGTVRTSGYWLYGSEYSEWYFSDKYWPDFDHSELKKAIASFGGVIRNFGK